MEPRRNFIILLIGKRFTGKTTGAKKLSEKSKLKTIVVNTDNHPAYADFAQITPDQLKTWNINKALLASKMGMPAGTFKNKLSESLPQYHFTEEEEAKLFGILREIAADIETVAGISFNQALGKIVRNKV